MIAVEADIAGSLSGDRPDIQRHQSFTARINGKRLRAPLRLAIVLHHFTDRVQPAMGHMEERRIGQSAVHAYRSKPPGLQGIDVDTLSTTVYMVKFFGIGTDKYRLHQVPTWMPARFSRALISAWLPSSPSPRACSVRYNWKI